jgi:hypothetical protein
LTLANGSQIDATDVSIATQLSTMRADAAALDLGYDWTYRWEGLLGTPATPLYERQAIFVTPDDVYLEAIGLQLSNQNGSTTVTLEAESTLVMPPISLTGTGGGAASFVKARSVLLDNAAGLPADSTRIASNPVARTLRKGAIHRITVVTTNTLGPQNVITAVTLALRSRYRRA